MTHATFDHKPPSLKRYPPELVGWVIKAVAAPGQWHRLATLIPQREALTIMHRLRLIRRYVHRHGGCGNDQLTIAVNSNLLEFRHVDSKLGLHDVYICCHTPPCHADASTPTFNPA